MILRNFNQSDYDIETPPDFLPYSGPSNTTVIDKIGLGTNTEYLNKEKCSELAKGVVTVIHNGNYSQINIHREYLPHIANHLERLCLAISELYAKGYLNILPDFYITPMRILKKYFKLKELEIAFDFVEYEPRLQFDNNCFRNHKGTRYSRNDFKRIRRIRNGRSLSKGMQHSFITYYDKGEKLQTDFPYFRFELRFQGKYSNNLTSFSLVDGTTEVIYEKLRKKIISICHKILETDSIGVYSSEMNKYPQFFNVFINDIGDLVKKI